MMVRKEFCIGVSSKVAWLQGFKNAETDNKIMHQQLLFEHLKDDKRLTEYHLTWIAVLKGKSNS